MACIECIRGCVCRYIGRLLLFGVIYSSSCCWSEKSTNWNTWLGTLGRPHSLQKDMRLCAFNSYISPLAADCAHVQQVTTDTQRATKGKIKGRKCCRLRTKVTATHRPLVHNILYPDMVMRDSDSWGIPTKTVTIEVFFLFFAMSFAFMAAI
jgi:hypothetical protein